MTRRALFKALLLAPLAAIVGKVIPAPKPEPVEDATVIIHTWYHRTDDMKTWDKEYTIGQIHSMREKSDG